MASTSGLTKLKPGHAATNVSIRTALATVVTTVARSVQIHINSYVDIDTIRSLFMRLLL